MQQLIKAGSCYIDPRVVKGLSVVRTDDPTVPRRVQIVLEFGILFSDPGPMGATALMEEIAGDINHVLAVEDIERGSSQE